MSVQRSRIKTLDNLQELTPRSFTQQLLRNASSGLPSRMRQRIRTELLKTEEQAKLSHSKLLMAKERKLEMEHLEEQKRKELETQLLGRQERSRKNLQKLRLSQRSSFDTYNKKLDETHSKLKHKHDEQMAQTLSQFNKTQQQMVSFYTTKEKQKKEHYMYLQSIHKSSVSTELDRTKRDSANRSVVQAPNKSLIESSPKRQLKIHINSIIKTTKAGGHYQPVFSRVSLVKKREKEKEDQMLEKFIGKMEEINNVRNKRMSKMTKAPAKAVQPLPHISTKIDNLNNPQKTPKSKFNDRYRFSEQYAKRLEQKKGYLQWSLQKRISNGQNFLKVQSMISQKNKVTKILNESKNQMRRRIHYSLMQQLRNAK